MKRYVLSAVIMLTSFCGFGQLLSPTLHIQERDTDYCFTKWQLIELTVITSNRYAFERKVRQQDTLINQLDTALASCAKQVQIMDTIAQNNYLMYQNQVKLTDALKEDLQATRKRVKKVKRQRTFALILAGVFGIVAIIK